MRTLLPYTTALAQGLLAVCFFAILAPAAAQGGPPVVFTPRDGDQLMPRTPVSLRATPRTLQVIWTNVFRADTGEFISSVPGIRHLTADDGTYQGSISAPRVFLGENAPVRYEIHFRNGPNPGDPETVVHALPRPIPYPPMLTRGGGQPSTQAGAPIVFEPLNNARLGPSTTVRIKATPGVVQTIWGEVIRMDTGEAHAWVPGIRHFPKADGTYEGRISTPRPWLGSDVPIMYRLHFRNGPMDGDPETIVIAYPAD